MLWGQPVAVVAVPTAWMSPPFNEAGPSQGGREGIEELEDNIHRDLGSNPIFVTPFLWITPYTWYYPFRAGG